MYRFLSNTVYVVYYINNVYYILLTQNHLKIKFEKQTKVTFVSFRIL